MSKERNRNHEYLYTVSVRVVTERSVKDDNGSVKTVKATSWVEQKVNACNIHEVAGRLHKDLNDIRYEGKEIIT